MTVRIKEIVVRYEDDGEISPLSAEAHHEKFAPLRLVVHHHCAPPPNQQSDAHSTSEPKEIKVDLSKLS